MEFSVYGSDCGTVAKGCVNSSGYDDTSSGSSAKGDCGACGSCGVCAASADGRFEKSGESAGAKCGVAVVSKSAVSGNAKWLGEGTSSCHEGVRAGASAKC